MFSRRFTVQERLGEQIADALAELIEPHGVAVHLEAVHLCTQMRGVREEHSKTVTTFWRGDYSRRTRSCDASSSPRRTAAIHGHERGSEASDAHHPIPDRRRRLDRRRRVQGHPRASTPTARSRSSATEAHPPYSRPPLSKALWKGDGGEHDLARHREARRRASARPADRRARPRPARGDATTRARRTRYERLLLATGGRPRRLPFGGDEVIYYRTLDDYRRLRELADAGARFVVIGGGFIGSEIAAALALNGCPVTMVFPGAGIGARIFPPRCRPRS